MLVVEPTTSGGISTSRCYYNYLHMVGNTCHWCIHCCNNNNTNSAANINSHSSAAGIINTGRYTTAAGIITSTGSCTNTATASTNRPGCYYSSLRAYGPIAKVWDHMCARE